MLRLLLTGPTGRRPAVSHDNYSTDNNVIVCFTVVCAQDESMGATLFSSQAGYGRRGG